jgi:hypothetical protein
VISYSAGVFELLFELMENIFEIATLVAHRVEDEILKGLVDLLHVPFAVGVISAARVSENHLDYAGELFLKDGLNELLRLALTQLRLRLALLLFLSHT